MNAEHESGRLAQRSWCALSVALGLALGLALGGCGGDEAAWAMQHATVEVQGDALVGFQVWEFYARGWKRDQGEEDHICARVQELEGQLTSDLDGCQACSATYEITLTELETDCTGPEATDANYAAITHFAVGDVHAEIAIDDPYPGKSLGWYQTWDAEAVDAMGFAWDERLEDGAVDAGPVSPGWNTDQRYVLWPAYAWELP